MVIINKFGLAVVKNNKLLLCEPFAFKDLIMPGGIIEHDENYITNLLREVEEELGRDAILDVKSLKYLGNFEDSAAGRINTIVKIELYIGNVHGILKASSEIKKLHWFGMDGDFNKLSLIVRNKIIPFLKDNNYLQ